MIELFFKHLDFVAPELTVRTHEAHEKYTYKFNDPLVNKHWLSFYATYNRGHNDALNSIIIPLVNQLKG